MSTSDIKIVVDSNTEVVVEEQDGELRLEAKSKNQRRRDSKLAQILGGVLFERILTLMIPVVHFPLEATLGLLWLIWFLL